MSFETVEASLMLNSNLLQLRTLRELCLVGSEVDVLYRDARTRLRWGGGGQGGLLVEDMC